MQQPSSDDATRILSPPARTDSPSPSGGAETPVIAAASVLVKSDGQEPPAPREPSLPAIDGYEVLGELGRGGMGVVYRARHVLLNRPCVLKMILAGDYADARTVARFRAEAEAVARLQHPNVVQIHHIGEAAEVRTLDCPGVSDKIAAAELRSAAPRGP